MRPISSIFAAAGLAVAATFTHASTEQPDPALVQAVADRSAEERTRDEDRRPVETLSFFQLEPGMTVAEALPGGGWYTRILANYLGSEGTLYGVTYTDSTWPRFSFATEEWTAQRIAASAQFPARVADFTDNGINALGFTFDTVPAEATGKVDRVLLIRALHNLNRFESQAGTLSEALAAIHAMLKPEGLVGVVQHRLPESHPAEGADGSRGYLKQSDVVAAFTAAGFELVTASEINANPADQPGLEDSVWRLPPSLRGSEDDPDRRAALQAIGESDRMTLLFSKAGG